MNNNYNENEKIYRPGGENQIQQDSSCEPETRNEAVRESAPFDTTAETLNAIKNEVPRDNDISAKCFEKNPQPEENSSCCRAEHEAAENISTNINTGNESVKSESEQNTQTGIVYHNSGNGYNWSYVEGDSSNKKKEKKKRSGYRIAALAIAGAFTLSFMAFTAFTIGNSFGLFGKTQNSNSPASNKENVFQIPQKGTDEKKQNNVEEAISVTDPSGKTALTINQIAEKCTPSAVGILVETEQNYYGRIFKSAGVGSGFILSEDGYIATNSHVVSGATTITVVLNDGTEHKAELVGADSVTDIAVVKIEATGLPVAELGNSDDLIVGELAVAIGTPASIELAGTVTDGIISAVDRKIDITDSYGRVTKTMTLIQTNATINPGNSGGPLINRFGQVIGINTLKLTAEFEGIGFAIPINGAIDIMNQLISDGVVTDRGYNLVTGEASIGIQCADISEQEAAFYGTPQGVLVIQIDKTSAAYRSGLRRGDIIIAFDGKSVETTEEINNIKTRHNPGDEVVMKIYRDGEGEKEIVFKLDIAS